MLRLSVTELITTAMVALEPPFLRRRAYLTQFERSIAHRARMVERLEDMGRFARLAYLARGNNDPMSTVRAIRNVIVLAALGFIIAAIVPLGASAHSNCDPKTAEQLRTVGDRYHRTQRYVEAAHSYLAATRLTRDCRTLSGALTSARSLAQAGTTLAQSGDFVFALSVLHAAQAKLTPLASDARTATAARGYADLVRSVITAIDTIAQASM